MPGIINRQLKGLVYAPVNCFQYLCPDMVKNVLLFLFFFACQITVKANFVYDANCIAAYKAILSLRMPEAKLLLRKEKQLNPQNGITILLENYIDYFSLLASENRDEYEKLIDNKSARVSALEDNDKNAPFYLFSQAEVYLQWAFIKARFGDYLSSGFDAKKANSLLKENQKKFPDFLPNQKSLALVNVIFGSIPASFRGIGRILGMSGNVQAGINQLEKLKTELPQSKFNFYNDEVVFFICTISIDALRNYQAYPQLVTYLSTIDNSSLLKSFLLGNIALKTAHNDDAILYLQASPRSAEYLSMPVMDYLLGNAKLNRMDSGAAVYLERYVTEFKGTIYVKDSYLKLAHFYLIQNNTAKYNYYIGLVKDKGNTADEKDKQALKEANDVKPDIGLLKARLYFDGGYYDKALAQLINKQVNNLTQLKDKIEYYYRLGRIYDKTGKTNDALLNYRRAINLGKRSSYYFAANAALSMGRIYEEKHDFEKAAECYNETIDMRGHEYQNSIDDNAKAGLKRVGG